MKQQKWTNCFKLEECLRDVFVLVAAVSEKIHGCRTCAEKDAGMGGGG